MFDKLLITLLWTKQTVPVFKQHILFFCYRNVIPQNFYKSWCSRFINLVRIFLYDGKVAKHTTHCSYIKRMTLSFKSTSWKYKRDSSSNTNHFIHELLPLKIMACSQQKRILNQKSNLWFYSKDTSYANEF